MRIIAYNNSKASSVSFGIATLIHTEARFTMKMKSEIRTCRETHWAMV